MISVKKKKIDTSYICNSQLCHLLQTFHLIRYEFVCVCDLIQ